MELPPKRPEPRHNRRVYVGPVARFGTKAFRGLFARSPIKKHQTIFVVQGTLMRAPYDLHFNRGSRWLSMGMNLWLSPLRSNPWWYINHSCRPNAGLKGARTVIALRDIDQDEHITIDYSWTEADPHWRMRCLCGDPNCRSIIRGIHSLEPRQFQRHKAYIPKFLQSFYAQVRRNGPGADKSR
jgi:hypothetical protein